MKNLILVSALALAITACSKEPKKAEQASAPPVVEVTGPEVAYERSKECFVYAGVNNMHDDGTPRDSTTIPALIDDAVNKGAALGKSADAVKAELLIEVRKGEGATAAMTQGQKEAYVQKSVDEAVTCLRELRTTLTK